MTKQWLIYENIAHLMTNHMIYFILKNIKNWAQNKKLSSCILFETCETFRADLHNCWWFNMLILILLWSDKSAEQLKLLFIFAEIIEFFWKMLDSLFLLKVLWYYLISAILEKSCAVLSAAKIKLALQWE